MDRTLIITCLILFGGILFWILRLLSQIKKLKRISVARKIEADGLRRELSFMKELEKGEALNEKDRADDIDSLLVDLDPRSR